MTERAAPSTAGGASRRAAGFAVAVLCLFLALKVAYAVATGPATQVPWVAVLFVLPLLYALPGPRRLMARYRWPVLAVQAVLTWVPFAIFGGRWVVGLGGLLAGLVLLTVRGRLSWPAAGLLLAADVVLRATLVGLPVTPTWSAIVWVVVAFIDDALVFFGMVRLAQIVGEVEDARRQTAELAVAQERLQAAGALQSAIGQRLADVSACTVAARQALSRDAAQARAHIQAVGAAAREAVAQAREVTPSHPSLPRHEPAAPPLTASAISARLAWAVLAAVLSGYAVQGVNNLFGEHDGLRLGPLVAAGLVLSVALQLRHSGAAGKGGRPRAWPVTLGLQAVLAYVFFLPFLTADVGVLSPFLAGSLLLLVPSRWRWVGYAAVVASYSVLWATVPLHGVPAAPYRSAVYALYHGATIAGVGLMVYGLSRLAGLARQLEGLRGELVRMAVVTERLRVARDMHDLLGLGLSAVALKADLIGALIGRDDARAAAEIGEMGRICAAARADIRLVTGEGARLSLAAELAAAEQVLASAGIQVRADVPAGRLPGVADEVLAPVLREAVTNVLRHAAAAACTIEVTAGGGAVRLQVGNDGVTQRPATGTAAGGEGRGLANLRARVEAAGGRLASSRDGGWFGLTAEIPLPCARPARAGLPGLRRPLFPAGRRAG
jgi:two-component system sensor histidine kinase DesK